MHVPQSDLAIMPWSFFLRLLVGRACDADDTALRWELEGRFLPAVWLLSGLAATRADSHAVVAEDDIPEAAFGPGQGEESAIVSVQ
jgi:hypothetical protein